jgi:hypothetical protein
VPSNIASISATSGTSGNALPIPSRSRSRCVGGCLISVVLFVATVSSEAVSRVEGRLSERQTLALIFIGAGLVVSYRKRRSILDGLRCLGLYEVSNRSRPRGCGGSVLVRSRDVGVHPEAFSLSASICDQLVYGERRQHLLLLTEQQSSIRRHREGRYYSPHQLTVHTGIGEAHVSVSRRNDTGLEQLDWPSQDGLVPFDETLVSTRGDGHIVSSWKSSNGHG